MAVVIFLTPRRLACRCAPAPDISASERSCQREVDKNTYHLFRLLESGEECEGLRWMFFSLYEYPRSSESLSGSWNVHDAGMWNL